MAHHPPLWPYLWDLTFQVRPNLYGQSRGTSVKSLSLVPSYPLYFCRFSSHLAALPTTPCQPHVCHPKDWLNALIGSTHQPAPPGGARTSLELFGEHLEASWLPTLSSMLGEGKGEPQTWLRMLVPLSLVCTLENDTLTLKEIHS